MKSQETAPEALSQSEALLDKAGAAALLNVSIRTVEAWTTARRIPYVKLGEGKRGAIRFRAAALHAWIEAQEVPAQTLSAKETISHE